MTGLVGPEPISTATQAALDAKVDEVASTDNAIARFDGTGGTLQNSVATIGDTGSMVVPANGNTFGASAIEAATAGDAIRPFNLMGTQASVRVWRTADGGDPALELISGSFGGAANATLWWDIFGKASNGNLVIRRRTGGNLQEKIQFAPDGTITVEANAALVGARVRPRVGTTASTATPAIDTNTVDVYTITALAANITGFTMTGTPTDGQRLWIAITGTAARTITWGASFEASTVALPTTTVSTNRLDVEFIWNAATSKWRCVRAV